MISESDNSLSTTMYGKPTHTDLYLQWDSHHNLAAKFSVINTLTHRTKTVCSSPQLPKSEEDHLKQALQRYKYPTCVLKGANIKCRKANRPNEGFNNIRNSSPYNNKKKPHIAVLTLKGQVKPKKHRQQARHPDVLQGRQNLQGSASKL